MTSRSPTEPRKRGSKPGVPRGPYKIIKVKEPQTPVELAALRERAREYWGDLYAKGNMVYARELGRYVSVLTYVPPPELERGTVEKEEVTSKVCSGCGLEWALHHFSPSRGGRGGVKSKCKSCCAEYAREHANTTQGKAARARAQAKFQARLAGEQRVLVARAAFIEAAGRTPAGRALLAAVGMTQVTHEKDEQC